MSHKATKGTGEGKPFVAGASPDGGPEAGGRQPGASCRNVQDPMGTTPLCPNSPLPPLWQIPGAGILEISPQSYLQPYGRAAGLGGVVTI